MRVINYKPPSHFILLYFWPKKLQISSMLGLHDLVSSYIDLVNYACLELSGLFSSLIAPHQPNKSFCGLFGPNVVWVNFGNQLAMNYVPKWSHCFGIELHPNPYNVTPTNIPQTSRNGCVQFNSPPLFSHFRLIQHGF